MNGKSLLEYKLTVELAGRDRSKGNERSLKPSDEF